MGERCEHCGCRRGGNPPHYVTYDGEQRSMTWLQKELHIGWDTLVVWKRRGVLTERMVKRHLAMRAGGKVSERGGRCK